MQESVDAEKRARDLIDKMLQDAGWTIVRRGNPIPDKGIFALEEVETPSGPMDYGLYMDRVLVGDIEAKPEKTGVPGILAQDERYSKRYDKGNFDFNGYHIPFLYASNGHIIWFRDVRSKYNLQKEIAKFHTPSALQEHLGRNIEEPTQWLKENPIDIPGIRPYQKEAIESIEAAILSRKSLGLTATPAKHTTAYFKDIIYYYPLV